MSRAQADHYSLRLLVRKRARPATCHVSGSKRGIAPADAELESRLRGVGEGHHLSTVGVMGLGSHLSRRLAYLQQVWLALMLEPALVWQGSCEGLCSAPVSETEFNGVGGLRSYILFTHWFS
jgi:hypothetical protein